jgi:hypothetical protein
MNTNLAEGKDCKGQSNGCQQRTHGLCRSGHCQVVHRQDSHQLSSQFWVRKVWENPLNIIHLACKGCEDYGDHKAHGPCNDG